MSDFFSSNFLTILAWPFKAANIKGLNFVSVLQGRFGSELKLIRVSTISMWPSEQA